jgi:uncharacterized protein DUF6278
MSQAMVRRRCTGRDNGTVDWWRRWMPGPKRGVARGVVVYGHPHVPDPDHLHELLGRCEQLRRWARMHGLVLSGIPEDLELLDQVIDELSPMEPSAQGNEAGLFLGTVILASVAGTRWRVWPNAHPVIRLASGRELDVVAMGNDRVRKGTPRLITVFTDAAADH